MAASRKSALERGTCVSFATRERIDDLYDEGRRYHPTLFGGDFFEENLDSCGKRAHATAQLALAHVHTLHWLAQQPMAQGPGATAIYNSARAGRAVFRVLPVRRADAGERARARTSFMV